MREYTIQEAIKYLDSLIVLQKEKGKNDIATKLIIVDNINIIDNITKYYNNQSVACKMKYCPLEKDYEIIIWW